MSHQFSGPLQKLLGKPHTSESCPAFAAQPPAPDTTAFPTPWDLALPLAPSDCEGPGLGDPELGGENAKQQGGPSPRAGSFCHDTPTSESPFLQHRPAPAQPDVRSSTLERGLPTSPRALASPSRLSVPDRRSEVSESREDAKAAQARLGTLLTDQAPAGASRGHPYRGVLTAVVADEAAAPRVPLCPAADVVDAALDDQPLVAWQVVRADLLPAEGGQRRPKLRGPLARPRTPAGLPDAAHGCVRKSSGTRHLFEGPAKHQGEPSGLPRGFSAAARFSAAPPRRCSRRTSVRQPAFPSAHNFPPL